MKIGGAINQCFWPHWIPDQSYLRCPRAEVGPSQSPSLAPSRRSPLRWWPGSCWSRSGARSAWWWRFSRLPGLRSPAPCTGAPSGGPACRWGTTCGWSCSLWEPAAGSSQRLWLAVGGEPLSVPSGPESLSLELETPSVRGSVWCVQGLNVNVHITCSLPPVTGSVHMSGWKSSPKGWSNELFLFFFVFLNLENCE